MAGGAAQGRKVGDVGVPVLFRRVERGAEKIHMPARERQAHRFAGRNRFADQHHADRLEVGVLFQRPSAGGARRIAVLVVQPEAQSQPFALVRDKLEQGPFVLAAQIVVRGDVGDHAAESLAAQLFQFVCDCRKISAHVPLRVPVKAVHDFQRAVLQMFHCKILLFGAALHSERNDLPLGVDEIGADAVG
ncbi:unknown [Clostridium sp. CAG:448]|nr:unknown [Clostridium sp. CAG:448]